MVYVWAYVQTDLKNPYDGHWGKQMEFILHIPFYKACWLFWDFYCAFFVSVGIVEYWATMLNSNCLVEHVLWQILREYPRVI